MILLLAIASFKQEDQDAVVKKVTRNFLQDKAILDKTINDLFLLINSDGTFEEKKDSIQLRLAACRNAYKKIEWVVSYYYPSLAVRINGPDVMEEEEPTEFEPAHGLQVIENTLTTDLQDTVQLKKITYGVKLFAGNIKGFNGFGQFTGSYKPFGNTGSTEI
jgi:hypothetical protein